MNTFKVTHPDGSVSTRSTKATYHYAVAVGPVDEEILMQAARDLKAEMARLVKAGNWTEAEAAPGIAEADLALAGRAKETQRFFAMASWGILTWTSRYDLAAKSARSQSAVAWIADGASVVIVPTEVA